MNMIKNLQILESEVNRICLNPNPASLPHLKDDRLQLSNVCEEAKNKMNKTQNCDRDKNIM